MAITILLLAGVVPFFLKAGWPKKTKKSLLLKMICSTLFILVGVLSILLAGRFSHYALWIFVRSRFFLAGGFLSSCQQQDALLLARLV